MRNWPNTDIVYRGSVFRKGKGRCGRPSKFVPPKCKRVPANKILGIASLSETNRERAAHKDVINSMAR